MKIAVVLYEGLTALDAIGPYEVLQNAPGVELGFVASKAGPVRCDFGRLTLHAGHALEELPSPDIVVVPGAPDPSAAIGDRKLMDWLKTVHETSRWTTSVCTGALVLGAAGLLGGRAATTHWLAMDALARFGARPTPQRVVRDGKLMTAAGVSAGIDMALTLVAEEWGEERAQEIQLVIEYDPQPPFDAGSPDKAPPAIRDRIAAQFSFD